MQRLFTASSAQRKPEPTSNDALHDAFCRNAKNGNLAEVITYLEGNAHIAGLVNRLNSDGESALLLAVREKRTVVIEYLLNEALANPNIQSSNTQETALMYACATQKDSDLNTETDMVTPLLIAGAHETINTVTPEGYTAIRYAAAKGKSDIVSLLLQHGAQVNPAIPFDTTLNPNALQIAVERKYTDTAKLLAKAYVEQTYYQINALYLYLSIPNPVVGITAQTIFDTFVIINKHENRLRKITGHEKIVERDVLAIYQNNMLLKEQYIDAVRTQLIQMKTNLDEIKWFKWQLNIFSLSEGTFIPGRPKHIVDVANLLKDIGTTTNPLVMKHYHQIISIFTKAYEAFTNNDYQIDQSTQLFTAYWLSGLVQIAFPQAFIGQPVLDDAGDIDSIMMANAAAYNADANLENDNDVIIQGLKPEDTISAALAVSDCPPRSYRR